MARPVIAYWVRLPGRWRATRARVTARLKSAQLPSSRLTSLTRLAVELEKLAVTAAKMRISQRPSSMTRSMPARRSRSTAVGRSRAAGRVEADTASGDTVAGVGRRAAASTRNLELGPCAPLYEAGRRPTQTLRQRAGHEHERGVWDEAADPGPRARRGSVTPSSARRRRGGRSLCPRWQRRGGTGQPGVVALPARRCPTVLRARASTPPVSR